MLDFKIETFPHNLIKEKSTYSSSKIIWMITICIWTRLIMMSTLLKPMD